MYLQVQGLHRKGYCYWNDYKYSSSVKLLVKRSLNIRSFLLSFFRQKHPDTIYHLSCWNSPGKDIHSALPGQKAERKSKMKAELESGSWVIKGLSAAGVLRVAPICQRERCVFSSAKVWEGLERRLGDDTVTHCQQGSFTVSFPAGDRRELEVCILDMEQMNDIAVLIRSPRTESWFQSADPKRCACVYGDKTQAQVQSWQVHTVVYYRNTWVRLP